MLKNPHEIEIEHMMECRSYTTARPLINAVTVFISYRMGLIGDNQKKRIIGILLYYSYEPSSIRWDGKAQQMTLCILYYYMILYGFQPHIM